MYLSEISIEWDGTIEYINLDITADKYPPIESTREHWKSPSRIVKYETRSEVEYGNTSNLLKVFYESKRNPHIKPDDSRWGVSEIKIEKGATQGYAKWTDNDRSDRSYNGEFRWQKMENSLYKNRRRYRTTQQQREQDLFRKVLLTFDEQCCLTGERTAAALEAAHLIPSKDLGAEIAENGIILRADLHKLFDRGCFRFDQEGKVVDVQNVSDEYRNILEGSKLPIETVNRVGPALSVLNE